MNVAVYVYVLVKFILWVIEKLTYRVPHKCSLCGQIYFDDSHHCPLCESEFVLSLSEGINLVAVPLKDERVTRVSDLAKLIGPDVSLITSRVQGKFLSFIPGTTPEISPANVEIKGYTGLIVVMKATKSITFKGVAWSDYVQLAEKGINRLFIGIPIDGGVGLIVMMELPPMGSNLSGTL